MKYVKFDLTKKEKGSIMKMLPVLLAMTVVCVMTSMYFSYMSYSDVREKADQIARKYILLMETTGYLDVDNKNDLILELSAIGYSEINLQGTTTTIQGYAEEVILNISASYVSEKLMFDNFLLPSKKAEVYHLKISKKTTAKC